jgi:hypothetical protein
MAISGANGRQEMAAVGAIVPSSSVAQRPAPRAE